MANWTDAQLDAIGAVRGTVLVSAAAGSGKTSVLVERVIRRITEEQPPIDADRLLIVTFTKAAAAEMRGRIEKALLDRIREDPENRRLQRQQVLLSKASICTVDSFCSKISREFFEVLGISPDFRIVSDKQQEDLQAQAMDAALGELFARGETALADCFSSERDDRRLIDAVMTLYEFTRSHLYPDLWLEEKLEEYDSSLPAAKTLWGECLLRHASDALRFCGNVIRDSLRAMQADEKLAGAAAPVFAEDAALVDAMLGAVGEKDWGKLSSLLKGARFSRFPTLRGYGEDPLKLRLQASRAAVKDAVGELTSLFGDSEAQVQADIAGLRPIAQGLSQLVRRFSELYQEAKREKNLADYSDIEHYAVTLFLKREGDTIVRTELAEEVSRRYEEIMIDEYQDTNDVQDWIFRAISKEAGNRFMVGDVKQSIYSFRQAMPDIFIGYKDRFRPYLREHPAYPALILLDKNFRSRPEVVSTVNFMFSMLMSREVGGVDYASGEALAQGLSCQPKPHCETVVDFLESSDEASMEEAEARHIAGIIREQLESGYTVTGRDGERPAEYRDFCILLRSANKYAYTYAQELAKNGVPAWAAVSGGFFAAPEVLGALSFLQVIDNPNQDIPMLSVLMSPVYGFTADDLAELRLEDRKDSLYVSMLLSQDGRYRQVLEDLERYRLLAATMPAHEFIAYFYSATGYPDLALAMENGESRLANLRRLRQYASDYEDAGYLGLSGFLRFMEKLRTSKSDLESANLISENANVVRVMSIHKSKGLEFPVCIIAGCGRKFNGDRAEVCLNSRLGLGAKLRDPATGARYSNAVREAVLLENRRNAASEELRVFYVAMTRAREKLIMVSTVKGLEKSVAAFSAQITQKPEIDPAVVAGATSISDWLLLCALKHPDGTVLREEADGSGVCLEEYTPWRVRRIKSVPEERVQGENRTEAEPWDSALLERIRAACEFVYPQSPMNRIPAKVTASALSGERKELSLNRPAFLSYQGLTPAERGIALHSFMQFADFKKPLSEELDRLVREGFLTEEQGAAVNLQRVRRFLESGLGRRIAASDTVRREQRFSVTIPAGMVTPELEEEYRQVPVILQGAVDCSFTENGKLYIVDFKTDRVEEGEVLAERYGMQLKLYAQALAQVTGLAVGGCSLYSLHLDREIPV